MPFTLFANADVRTLDPALPRAEAILESGGRIVAVGGLSECRDASGPGRDEVDLGGRVVLPGFIDAHMHLASYARDLGWLDLRGAGDIAAALAMVRTHVTGLGAEQWVLGGRWDPARLAATQLHRAMLDEICPRRPVVLSSRDGHTVWANSAALRHAGIDLDHGSPSPLVLRDHTGRASGVVRAAEAVRLRRLAEVADDADVATLLRRGFAELLRYGITGIHDHDGAPSWDGYAALHAREQFPLRVLKSVPADLLDAVVAQGRRTGDGDLWLRTGPVKIFTDGTLSSRSAAMLGPYPSLVEGDEPHFGGAHYSDDELHALIETAIDGGIAVAAHAIGDRANRQLLDVFAAVAGRTRSAGLRHRIEHAQHLSRGDLPRLAELGVIASMQPTHCTSDWALAQQALGGREVFSYAWRSLAASGAVLAFGADAPVEAPDPLLGLRAALTRTDRNGAPPGGWLPDECLDLDTAIRAYTEGPAYAAGEEADKGRLTRGRLADFVVLDADPWQVPADSLGQVCVEMTVVGGRVRWARS